MKRSLVYAALVATLALAPAAASADTMGTTHDAMTSTSHDAMMAGSTMWMCHPTQSGEKPTAMTAVGDHNLTCRSIDVHKLMAGPSTAHAMSADDVNKAWKSFLQRQVSGQY